jgi:hypothetical protein
MGHPWFEIVHLATPEASYELCAKHDLHFHFMVKPGRKTALRTDSRDVSLSEEKANYYQLGRTGLASGIAVRKGETWGNRWRCGERMMVREVNSVR